MNIFIYYKQIFGVILLSILLVGCSGKSKNNNSNTPPPSTQPGGNSNSGDRGNGAVGFGGADQNVTEGDFFTVEATKPDTLGEGVTYEWKTGDIPLGNEASYTGKLEKGEHTLTVTATDASGKSESDDVSIKIGKYIISKEYITDCNGKLTVKIHKYDSNQPDRLVSIEEYRDASGKNPEKSGEKPYAVSKYEYDKDNIIKTTTTPESSKPIVERLEYSTRKDTRDSSGTGNIVTTDQYGTKRTFTYENYILVSGKAEYKNGEVRNYEYQTDDNGKLLSVTVKDADGNIVETNKLDEKGNIIEDNKDNSCPVTKEFEYRFIWDY